MADYQHVEHTFGPVFDSDSEVLILGSFPSVKSREKSFYYGHPQNRFWKMLATIYRTDCPIDIEGKKRLLLQNRLALWDVVDSCDIVGSSDSSIRNISLNDISVILEKASIRTILFNGEKAYRMTKMDAQWQECQKMIPCYKLPSTSPANAAFSMEKLVEVWGKALLE